VVKTIETQPTNLEETTDLTDLLYAGFSFKDEEIEPQPPTNQAAQS